MLKFTVEGQKLELIGDPFVVADSFDYLTGEFRFYSGYDWDLTEKHVFFQLGEGTPYEVVLVDNKFVKKDHVNLTTGTWSIYVIGYDIDGATLVERITTNKVSLTVDASGVQDGEPFPPSIIPDILVTVDQSTPQRFVGGIPKLAADREISDDNDLVDKKYVDDASPDLSGVLALDQTTPQELSASPLLDPDRVIDNSAQLVDKKYVDQYALGGSGFAANLYFTTIDSAVAGYKKISYLAEASETELTIPVTTTEALARTYLFDDGLGVTVIDGGKWSATYRAKVSSAQGAAIRLVAFLRHTDNTETTLFSATSDKIINTTYQTLDFQITQPSFECLTTDRIGFRLYASTTHPAGVTLYTIVGDGNASYVNTPIALRHAQLRDKNGESDVQHMTAAQIAALHSHSNKTALDAVSGTNTGDQDVSGAISTHNTDAGAHANLQRKVINDEGNYYETDTVEGALQEIGGQLDDITPLSGASAPTTLTVGVVKQTYINTATGDVYVCTSSTGGVYTWIRQSLYSDNTAIKAKFNTVLLNAFINPRTSIYLEETKKDAGKIYLKLTNFAISLPWTTYTWSNITAALPTYIKTSPKGVAGCIEILSNYLLVLRGTTFICRHHSEINRYTDSVIAWCFAGNLIGGLAFDSLQMKLSDDISFNNSLTDGNTDCIALADRIMANQEHDSFTFCMVSDSHSDYVSHVLLADSPEMTYNRALHMGAYCRINLNIMGGDILTYYDGTDKEQSRQTISRYISNFVSKAKSPLSLTIGNHDSNTYASTGIDATKTRVITPHELYLHIGVHNTALTRDADNPEGIYGYFDDSASQIRFFMLNTFDFPLVEADGDPTKWKYHGDNFAGFQNAQLNWFGASLESLPAGWAAMVFSHIPPETTVTDGVRFGLGQTVYNATPFFGIVNAFRDGTTYSADDVTGDVPYDVSVDFISRGAGEFIAFVCGHVPDDNTSDEVGGVSAPEYGYRYISIDGGIRFAVFDINRTTKTINVYKYGGANLYDPAMAHPPIIGLLAADVNAYGDFTTTYI